MALALGQREGPVDEIGDDDRFRIQSRMEIVGLLRAVAAHRELVTVQFGSAEDFVVSAVLAVNPDFEEVVLDYGANEAAMQRLLKSERLRISTQLDHVRIYLEAGVAEAVRFEDGLAFRIRLPESVLRFQRRDSYRLKIPLGRPLLCEVPANDEGTERVSVRVRDISVAGVGLTDFPKAFRLAVGMVWPGCRINLPELGTLAGELEVMHTTEGDIRRAGCRFRNLSFPMQNLIQRYITRVERQQHANR
ncbi:MAG TPA: flagellar brake protein [Casimicrobiaceae bacterium]|jgi:flagellar brake protein|nr:flagellar brake protein [Casimicrobiaceae bacterium]